MNVVIISAGAEWRAVWSSYSGVQMQTSPWGEWFCAPVGGQDLVFIHGGWGKISAAGSAQYAVDRWRPKLLINLGTCGGFAGHIDRDEVVLAERTLVYDIVEQMGDAQAAIDAYSTTLDLAWLRLPLPHPVRRGLLLSGDRDLIAGEVEGLHERYGAAAGDWESGAIAYVAARNGVRCLILRGVSDLVDAHGGELYGDLAGFQDSAARVMTRLLGQLPNWVAHAAA